MADNWVLPTSHNDVSTMWSNEANAYDGNTVTFANTSWDQGGYLELILSSIICDKIRLYASDEFMGGPFDPDINIDVYYSAGWHNIKNGTITKSTWVEISLGSTEIVTKARISGKAGVLLQLFEFNFNRILEPLITIQDATEIGVNQVQGNGEIVGIGDQDCDERGFEYGLTKTATWEKKETAGGYGVGPFNLIIDGLIANTEYWYRAFASYLLEVGETEKTTSGVDKDYPQLQVVGDIIYITWQQRSGGKTQIYLGTMKTDGSDWTVVKLTTSAYNKIFPQFHIVGTKIYYVWQEDDGADYQIWTALSDLDGSNFVATEQTTSAIDRSRPQLQVVGTKIYYIYEKSVSGYFALWMATADLDGTNWSAVQVHWQSLHGIYKPQFEVVGEKIYYAFSKRISSSFGYDGFCIGYSDLDGSNFWWNYGDSDSTTHIEPSQLQVVGTKIYYVYGKYKASDPYHQIMVASADLDGSNFSKTKKTTSAYNKRYPQLQVVGTKIYYVWSENDGSYNQIWTSIDINFVGYSEWIKFQTIASGTIPTDTLINICSDYSGGTYQSQMSEMDDGGSYVAYFVINTDLTNKKGLTIYKRILDLHLYYRVEASGTSEIYVKRDNEAEWQYLGSVSLVDATEPSIIIKHLAVDVKAKSYDFKVSFGNACRFIGVVFEFIPGGGR